jgi:hypothetical protein
VVEQFARPVQWDDVAAVGDQPRVEIVGDGAQLAFEGTAGGPLTAGEGR